MVYDELSENNISKKNFLYRKYGNPAIRLINDKKEINNDDLLVD